MDTQLYIPKAGEPHRANRRFMIDIAREVKDALHHEQMRYATPFAGPEGLDKPIEGLMNVKDKLIGSGAESE